MSINCKRILKNKYIANKDEKDNTIYIAITITILTIIYSIEYYVIIVILLLYLIRFIIENLFILLYKILEIIELFLLI